MPQQFSVHISNCNLFETFQSAFTACHSGPLLTVDSDSTSLFLLLDLSAAFDTIDHCVLPDYWEDQIWHLSLGFHMVKVLLI